jgi:hypothetical protein
MEEVLFPGYLENEIPRCGYSARELAENIKKWRRHGKRSKKFRARLDKTKEDKERGQMRLGFPSPEVEKVYEAGIIPDPLNEEELFGLNKEFLLYSFAAEIRNLGYVIPLRYGMTLLRDNSPHKKDIVRHVFQNLSARNVLNLIHNVGRSKIEYVGFDGLKLNVRKELKWEDCVDLLKDPEKELRGFVGFMLNEFPSAGFPDVERGGNRDMPLLNKSLENIGMFPGRARVDLLHRYERDLSFLDRDWRIITQRGDKHSMDTVVIPYGSKVVMHEKEHPGVSYMEEVIFYLEKRDYPSN